MPQINLPPQLNQAIVTSGGKIDQLQKSGESTAISQQGARALLQNIRAQITSGGTVQTGYLSLQKSANGEFNIENRSRFSMLSGDKAEAAALIRVLVRTAYSDEVGSGSIQTLEKNIDAYLGAKWFGAKLGTVSFVNLINSIESRAENSSGSVSNKKSSMDALLGAGGSLVIDETTLAEGAKKIQDLKSELELCSNQSGILLQADTSESLPATLSQLNHNSTLITRVMSEQADNAKLTSLSNSLSALNAKVTAKLNADISTRVDTIRGAGDNQLNEQIQKLSVIHSQALDAIDSSSGTITESNISKINDALTLSLSRSRTIETLQKAGDELCDRCEALGRQNIANTIPEVVTQLTQLRELGSQILALETNNEGLSELQSNLNNAGQGLTNKLNNDISSFVDDIRGAGSADLSEQVQQLTQLKNNVLEQDDQSERVVTETTRNKIDEALKSATAEVDRQIAQNRSSIHSAQSLISSASKLMGIRLNTPGAQSTNSFNQPEITTAFKQHQQMSETLTALRKDAQATSSGNIRAEIEGVATTLRNTRTVLEQRMSADISALVSKTKQEVERHSQAGEHNGVINQILTLVKLDASIKAAAEINEEPFISRDLSNHVSEALESVEAAAAAAMNSGIFRQQLDMLVRSPSDTTGNLASKAIDLNALLEQTNLLLTQLPPGAQADSIQQLQQDISNHAYDLLDQLKNELTPSSSEPRPLRISGSPAEAQRGQAMADLQTQAHRLQSLVHGQAGIGDVAESIQNLVAALPGLRQLEARSMLLDWAPAGSTQPGAPSELGAAIDASPNSEKLNQALVTLYERGLFQLGDPFMSKLVGVLDRGEVRLISETKANLDGIQVIKQSRVEQASLQWLTEMADGDPLAVNALLNQAQWDDIALSLKKLAPGCEAPEKQALIERDHAVHCAKRTLDGLLRSANPSWGTGGGVSFNPLNQQGMQSLRFDAQTVDAILKASEKALPANGLLQSALSTVMTPARLVDVSSMELMLAYLIAMDTPLAEGSLDESVIAQQEKAKSVLLKLSFMEQAGMNESTPAALILAKAMEWGGGTQTEARGLLQAADKIKELSNKISGNATALLAGLKAYDNARDPIRAKADTQLLTLKAHLFALGKSEKRQLEAQFETPTHVYERLARPLQNNLSNAKSVDAFVQGLRSTQKLAFKKGVDLSEVRGMAARLVSAENTRRLGGGVVEYLFGLKSSQLRTSSEGNNLSADAVIRNNLNKAPLAEHLLKDPTLSRATHQRFSGIAQAVGRAANSSATVRANMPKIGDEAQQWQEFVSARSTSNGRSVPTFGPYPRPSATGAIAMAAGMAQPETEARKFLNNLWEDLANAVTDANKTREPTPEQMAKLHRLADRYLALVEIGERDEEIQSALQGLEAGKVLRQKSSEAVQQVRSANPEAPRVAMLMILDVFQATGLPDLNTFRESLLTREDQNVPSGLEVELSERFSAIGLSSVAGTAPVNFCKALLLSEENANSLLDDHPKGWKGKISDLISDKLGIVNTLTVPKEVREFIARQQISKALNHHMSQLLPGQAFEIRVTQSGEIELTVPTTLPGVDATTGFSLSRDNSLMIRKEGDDRYSVVGKYSAQAGLTGGISAFGEALSLSAGVAGGAGSGFQVSMDSLASTQEFVQSLFVANNENASQPNKFIDAASRAAVLSSGTGGASVEATAKIDVMAPAILGLSLGLELRADASAEVRRESSTEISGRQLIETVRVTQSWQASGFAGLGATVTEFPSMGEEAPLTATPPADVVDSAEEEDDDAEIFRLPASLSAAISRSEFEEHQVVTRNGVVHPSTARKKGFMDHPAHVSAPVKGQVTIEKTLLAKRIATLLEGTPFADKLNGSTALSREVDRLISIAQLKPYEISLTSTLKSEAVFRIAELRQQGNSSGITKALEDANNYEPATLELVYIQGDEDAPKNRSSIEDPEEHDFPGIDDSSFGGRYSKESLAELSTRVTVQMKDYLS